MKQLAILLLIAVCYSCMSVHTSVGEYAAQEGEPITFDKGKRVYLFWGLLPINDDNVRTPQDGNCQVVVKHNLGDGLISWVTFGFVKTYTVKVRVKKIE